VFRACYKNVALLCITEMINGVGIYILVWCKYYTQIYDGLMNMRCYIIILASNSVNREIVLS